MKKEATPKMRRGSFKKTSDEKKATLRNVKGLIQKTSNEKRGSPKNHKGFRLKRPPMKKEVTPKTAKGFV
jgi:hypothetical protein